MDILSEIQQGWENKREELVQSSEKILTAVQSRNRIESVSNVTNDNIKRLTDSAFKGFKNNFDQEYGGFGTAPKFPTPHNLMFLLRYYKSTKNNEALKMVKKTLDKMYRGGIYDHLGYGFSRYSTDDKWLVPHFEKMLYDNALLAIVYLETYQITKEKSYAAIAKEILSYIIRDMTSEEGGFYSAEDADSEGVEGKFYVWTSEEIKDILGQELGAEFCKYYDITQAGNFEGKNIPNLIEHIESKVKIDEKFTVARRKLFNVREERVHPYKDDKILTAWNGLMIAAMAMAAQVLKDNIYQDKAEEAVDFIWNKLRGDNGRLLARYREGEAAYLAYADDYAFLIWGLIELYETTFKAKYLKMALELNQDLIKYFWDDKRSGLYLYGSDSEELITRPKEIYDGATPSGNSVATLNFLRLAKLTGDNKLEEKAEKQFKFFFKQVKQNPIAYSYFMSSLLFVQDKGREIVIAGEQDHQGTEEMLQVLKERFTPFTVTVLKDQANKEELSQLTGSFIAQHKQIEGRATAYICQDFACQAPITDIEEFKKELE